MLMQIKRAEFSGRLVWKWGGGEVDGLYDWYDCDNSAWPVSKKIKGACCHFLAAGYCWRFIPADPPKRDDDSCAGVPTYGANSVALEAFLAKPKCTSKW